jgi:hypothetical protein
VSGSGYLFFWLSLTNFILVPKLTTHLVFQERKKIIVVGVLYFDICYSIQHRTALHERVCRKRRGSVATNNPDNLWMRVLALVMRGGSLTKSSRIQCSKTNMLKSYIIFEFQMQYQTTIYFPQQFAVQNSNAFSDSSFVYGSYLVTKST